MSSQVQQKQYYESMRVFELKKIASDMNIKGRSIMRKQQLVDAIMTEWTKDQQQINSSNLCIQKTLYNCSGLTIEGDSLIICQNKCDKQHCSDHAHRYRLEKPDDCPICMDTISCRTETPLECGHWIHKECLIPTNIHICPVCRQQMQQHEVEFVFGRYHEQYNRYSENNFLPFSPESFQNENDIVQEIDYNDFNNQEHFFNEMPWGNYGENQEYDNFENNEQVEYENPFFNMTDEIIDLIIREIETSPEDNVYVTLPNNIAEIPQNSRFMFVDFVYQIIYNFGTMFNFHIDDLMNDTIRSYLFSNDIDHNLLSIYFNLSSGDRNIDFLLRIERQIHDRIRIVHNNLTFSN